jgi:hypothetical protein
MLQMKLSPLAAATLTWIKSRGRAATAQAMRSAPAHLTSVKERWRRSSGHAAASGLGASAQTTPFRHVTFRNSFPGEGGRPFPPSGLDRLGGLIASAGTSTPCAGRLAHLI